MHLPNRCPLGESPKDFVLVMRHGKPVKVDVLVYLYNKKKRLERKLAKAAKK